MTADEPEAGKVFAPGGRGKAGTKGAPSKAAMQAPKISAAVIPNAGDAQEDARLETWAEQFDAKLNQLTARQDAFLKYLELHSASGLSRGASRYGINPWRCPPG